MTTTTTKKKRVSKRNKAAWRKHCDITDVEAYLEDQRLEERLGKFEEKANEELFIIDTAGDEKKEQKVEDKPNVKQLSLKQKKRAQLAETPKCFEVLLPASKVPDPNAKRNHVNPAGTKPTALSKVSDKRKYEKGTLAKRVELIKKNKKIAYEKKKKSKSVRQTFDKNLWGDDVPEAKGIPATLCGEFISPEAQLHNVPTTKRLRPKPALPKTVVTRAAVELPHPGVSYNPSFQEHQELLQEVVKHEQVMMRKEAHLHRVTTGMFSRVTQQEKEKQWREEMSAGLPLPHKPEDDKDEQPSDNEYRAINPPVQNKKKDHKARRKQKERLAEKERLKREKIDKKKITDIYKLRKLKAAVVEKEKKQVVLREKRQKKKEEVAEKATPALNAIKPKPREPDFVDPKDLSGDLRTVRHSTNLLRERYESLQHRGALAAAKIMMKKRRKVKSYFKPGHKVTDSDVQKVIDKASGKVTKASRKNGLGTVLRSAGKR
ncbi:ribosome biogenesis protein NOP53 [Aricia agestis]|uniref:ribosome biogenesis protein NOP53 n=1 Tax=Aricia agestis TaxID=91739 RepID=UPI001C20A910|nr:ribosome biogenesis protein NOP53 [Aricia agestis]